MNENQHEDEVMEPNHDRDGFVEAEEMFRIAFENAPVGMSIIDSKGKYLNVNAALCQMVGYTAEELMSGTLQTISHPDDIERGNLWIKKMMSGDYSEPDFEKRYIHRDGHIVWGVVRARWVRNPDGSPRLSVTHIQDITERKHSEQALQESERQLREAQKMEAIGHLAGGLAHDFNNLLTVIGGNASLCQINVRHDDPVYNHLSEINSAVQSAANLTRQLLAFSRKQVIDPKVLDLNGVILRLRQMLTRVVGEDIELTTVLAENLGCVCFDPGQIEQILINLALNARDAMVNGGKLTFETSNIRLDENYCKEHGNVVPGEYVMLAVSDTGAGMSDEVKTHMFEPFYTTKMPGKGTGLGLAMVYGAVNQNNGTIEVYSELNQGTTIKVYLPRVNQMPQELRPNSSSTWPRGTETLVLVEDDDMVRSLALRILQRQGYRVHAFSNGIEALHAVEILDEHIDLLVTDVIMPNMNGHVLSEKLKAMRPDIRVLFTSGYTHNVIVHHGVLEEGVEFLAKPYTLELLAKRVRGVLDRETT